MNTKWIFAAFFSGLMVMGGAGRLSAHCGHCGMGEDSAKGKMGPVDEKVDHLGKSLGLSDAQKSQLKPIIEETWAKKEALMKQHKEQMEAIHKEKSDRISYILTPEQKAKWDAMKADGPMMKGGHGKGKEKMCEHCGKGNCTGACEHHK